MFCITVKALAREKSNKNCPERKYCFFNVPKIVVYKLLNAGNVSGRWFERVCYPSGAASSSWMLSTPPDMNVINYHQIGADVD